MSGYADQEKGGNAIPARAWPTHDRIEKPGARTPPTSAVKTIVFLYSSAHACLTLAMPCHARCTSSGSVELLMLGLDYYDHTEDVDEFAESILYNCNDLDIKLQ